MESKPASCDCVVASNDVMLTYLLQVIVDGPFTIPAIPLVLFFQALKQILLWFAHAVRSMLCLVTS